MIIKNTNRTESLKDAIFNAVDKRTVATAAEELVAYALPDVNLPDGSTRGRNATQHDVEHGGLRGDVKLITTHSSTGNEKAAHCNRWPAGFFVMAYPDTATRQIRIYDTIGNKSATSLFASQDEVTFNPRIRVNKKSTKQNINTETLLNCRVTIV